MTQSLPGRLFEAECGLASRLFRTSWLSLPVAFSLTCGWHDGQWWWLEYTDVSSNGNDWKPSGPRADMTPLPAFGQRFEFELEEESVSSLPASSWSTERKLLTGLGDCFGSVAAPADGDRIR